MSDVDELIAFLRAQLDKDERVARAAMAANDHRPWSIEEPDPERMPQFLWLNVMDSVDPASMPLAMAEHMSRWDPARVLAEVEANRRVLDAHGRPHECIELTGSGDHSVVDGQPWELWELAQTVDHGPCFVVRMLAQPYAGRDGWREEWRI